MRRLINEKSKYGLWNCTNKIIVNKYCTWIDKGSIWKYNQAIINDNVNIENVNE